MKRVYKVMSQFRLSYLVLMQVTKFDRFTLQGVMRHAYTCILILSRNFVLTCSVVTHIYLYILKRGYTLQLDIFLHFIS
jgi:hypothetical protein